MQALVGEAIAQGYDTVDPATLAKLTHAYHSAALTEGHPWMPLPNHTAFSGA